LNQQTTYAIAAFAAALVVLWNLIVMQSGNDELQRRGDAQRLAAHKREAKDPKGDGHNLMTLIHNWLYYNNVRASLALVATIARVAATFQ
jgi:hypothetical protein